MSTPMELAVRAYTEGASSRAASAAHGVDDKALRLVLRDRGLTRPRGQRPIPADVVEAIITDRRRHKLTWAQISAKHGVAQSAGRRAYLAATGNPGHVDRHPHLTPAQANRLQRLYDAIPSSGGTDDRRAVRTSAEGAKYQDALRALIGAGIAQVEIAELLHVTPSAIAYAAAE